MALLRRSPIRQTAADTAINGHCGAPFGTPKPPPKAVLSSPCSQLTRSVVGQVHSLLESSSHAIGGAFAVVQRTRAIYPRTVPVALASSSRENPDSPACSPAAKMRRSRRAGYASPRGPNASRLSAQLPSSLAYPVVYQGCERLSCVLCTRASVMPKPVTTTISRPIS